MATTQIFNRFRVSRRCRSVLTALLPALLMFSLVATGGSPALAAASSQTSFEDVSPSDVFASEVAWLADAGITKGCNPPANSKFCPDDRVTRGQMAAFLVRALKLPSGSASFSDTKGHVFEADIAALAAAGITKGCNPPANSKFCPDDHVTRGQMAAFLVRAFDLPTSTVSFSDLAGSVFSADVAALAAADITRGCNPPANTKFCPDAAVTRGQMAAFLFRALTGSSSSTLPSPSDEGSSGGGSGSSGGSGSGGSAPSPAGPPVSSVVAGSSISCAVLSPSGLRCWGFVDGEHRSAPVKVVGADSLVSVATGVGVDCGLSASKAAFCWGDGFYGQLGDGDLSRMGSHKPQRTPVAVAGGLTFSVVDPGWHHTCGLTTAGEAYCWGYGAEGRLGTGSSEGHASFTPVAVAGGLKFVALATGDFHTCAVTATGDVYCWGVGSNGQLGNGSTAPAVAPSKVASDVKFSSISAGGAHTCAVSTAGDVFCWGDNSNRQVGSSAAGPVTSPRKVSAGVKFASVSAGVAHTCALSVAGEAFCWGSNFYGALGAGLDDYGDHAAPQRVAGGLSFAEVSAGSFHSCAVTASDAQVFCWGNNTSSQLGVGKSVYELIKSPSPLPVVWP